VHDLVFPNTSGNYENSHNLLRRGLHRALRKAGLRKIRFHDLRHTCASLMLARGVGIKQVQAHLGHASANITLDVYSHLMPDAGSPGADAFQAMFGGSEAVAETGEFLPQNSPTHGSNGLLEPLEAARDAVAGVVAREGIEPPTRGFSVRCSTN
jgi:hypothetical protein